MKKVAALMDYFVCLPDCCIEEILSLTSPKDASKCAAVSWGFKFAADSDVVWGKFLPSDIPDIISESQSKSLLAFPFKKGLYLSLCDSPILLDGGTLSFSLDKKTGKKCVMAAAWVFSLLINTEQVGWSRTEDAHSRFGEVANLKLFLWFDIHGKIETRLLSERTRYVVYLVFKLVESPSLIDIGYSEVRFVDCKSDIEAVPRRIVPLPRRKEVPTGKAQYRERADGWIEIELGRFFNDVREDGGVQEKYLDVRYLFLQGDDLIVLGLEFRPE